MRETLNDRLLAGFADTFGGAPDGVARAPGRVNLIGEHTDYNDGFAMPAALGVETRIAFRRRADGGVRVVAIEFDKERDAFEPAANLASVNGGGWRNYVRGVFAILAARGYATPAIDIAIAGDIPRGTGLSSSASLEVALVRTITAASGEAYDPVTAALLAQSAENDFVGMRCGNLDQLASAGTKRGTALLIDCRSLELTPVPMPPGLAILIVQSGVVRGLVEGHYNLRRQWCEEAAAAIGVPALRDADLTHLEVSRAKMSDEAFRSGRHIIMDSLRTLSAADALRDGDLVQLGRLMRESHISMRDDFRITVEATDRLAALLNDVIGAEGGARQTGGGFGGAVVALLREDRVADAIVRIRADYRTPTGEAPMIMVETAQDGAGLVA